MAACAILRMDYPPSANRLWRYVSGRAIKSAEYRAWLTAQSWKLLAQKEATVSGPYVIHFMVCRPDKRKRDLGNLEKALHDAIVAAGFVDDDSLAQKITVEWVIGQPDPVKVFIISTAERT